MKSVVFILMFVLSLYAKDANQTLKPKWEVGLGIGALVLPHYRGSDQEAFYAAPIPYLRYHGKRLKVDREGARFYFYEGDLVKVDMSAAFAFAVDSDKNRARVGMTDLESILELGPRIKLNLFESKDKDLRFRFGLPVRSALAVSVQSIDPIGWVVAPYLQLRYHFHPWESALSVGPVWASNSYHDYFYSVTPEYATATRPVYDASSGFSGSRVAFSLSTRYKSVFFGMFAKYDNLNNATFIDSPLIRQNDSFLMGLALSWVFENREK